MIRKEPKIFDVNLADEYFFLNPKALNITSNKDLYSFCNAQTTVKKQNLRRRKKERKAKTIVSDPPEEKSRSGRKKLTWDYIEKLIVDGLEDNPGNIPLIRTASEFYLKVSSKKEILEDDIDMEALKQIGIKISDSE